MATQSKIGAETVKDIILDVLIGTKKKKLMSGAILLIIAFLIHVQTMNNGSNFKLRPRNKDGKKVLISSPRKEAKVTSMQFSCQESENS